METAPYRESHSAEKAARIVLLVDRALLVGHTVIGSRNKKLSRAFNANNREDTERDEKAIAVPAIIQRTADSRSDPRGDLIATTAATAAVTPGLDNSCGKKHRLRDLHNTDGYIACAIIEVSDVARADSRITAIDADVPYAAVKNHLLFHNGDPAELLITADPHAGFHLHLDIETDGYLIEALIEADGIDADIGPKDLRTLGTDGCRVIDDLPTKIRKKDDNVLVAITVTAGIKHAEGIDTDGFAIGCRSTATGNTSIIRHLFFPLS